MGKIKGIDLEREWAVWLVPPTPPTYLPVSSSNSSSTSSASSTSSSSSSAISSSTGSHHRQGSSLLNGLNSIACGPLRASTAIEIDRWHSIPDFWRFYNNINLVFEHAPDHGVIMLRAPLTPAADDGEQSNGSAAIFPLPDTTKLAATRAWHELALAAIGETLDVDHVTGVGLTMHYTNSGNLEPTVRYQVHVWLTGTHSDRTDGVLHMCRAVLQLPSSAPIRIIPHIPSASQLEMIHTGAATFASNAPKSSRRSARLCYEREFLKRMALSESYMRVPARLASANWSTLKAKTGIIASPNTLRRFSWPRIRVDNGVDTDNTGYNHNLNPPIVTKPGPINATEGKTHVRGNASMSDINGLSSVDGVHPNGGSLYGWNDKSLWGNSLGLGNNRGNSNESTISTASSNASVLPTPSSTLSASSISVVSNNTTSPSQGTLSVANTTSDSIHTAASGLSPSHLDDSSTSRHHSGEMDSSDNHSVRKPKPIAVDDEGDQNVEKSATVSAFRPRPPRPLDLSRLSTNDAIMWLPRLQPFYVLEVVGHLPPETMQVLEEEGCALCLSHHHKHIIANHNQTEQKTENNHHQHTGSTSSTGSFSQIDAGPFLLLTCKVQQTRHVMHLSCAMAQQLNPLSPTIDGTHITNTFRILPIRVAGALPLPSPDEGSSSRSFSVEYGITHTISNAHSLHISWPVPLTSMVDAIRKREYLFLPLNVDKISFNTERGTASVVHSPSDSVNGSTFKSKKAKFVIRLTDLSTHHTFTHIAHFQLPVPSKEEKMWKMVSVDNSNILTIVVLAIQREQESENNRPSSEDVDYAIGFIRFELGSDSTLSRAPFVAALPYHNVQESPRQIQLISPSSTAAATAASVLAGATITPAAAYVNGTALALHNAAATVNQFSPISSPDAALGVTFNYANVPNQFANLLPGELNQSMSLGTQEMHEHYALQVVRGESTGTGFAVSALDGSPSHLLGAGLSAQSSPLNGNQHGQNSSFDILMQQPLTLVHNINTDSNHSLAQQLAVMSQAQDVNNMSNNNTNNNNNNNNNKQNINQTHHPSLSHSHSPNTLYDAQGNWLSPNSGISSQQSTSPSTSQLPNITPSPQRTLSPATLDVPVPRRAGNISSTSSASSSPKLSKQNTPDRRDSDTSNEDDDDGGYAARQRRQSLLDDIFERPRSPSFAHDNANVPMLQLTLDQVRGNVVRLAKTHPGSRFLQAKLDARDATYFALMFQEMQDCLPELMIDNFSHFSVEKLISLCDDSQVLTILQKVAPQLSLVACQKHGSFSVQALVDACRSVQSMTEMIEAIRGDVLRIITNASGHFVILRMLQKFPAHMTRFIDEAVASQCAQIGIDHHGLRVTKALLTIRSSSELNKLFKSVARLTMKLVENQYGNYTIQHALDVAPPAVRTQIKSKMEGKFMRLSKQKFSSNVIEKCLRTSSHHWRHIIIMELIAQPGVAELLRDRYGNYVLQTALSIANGQEVGEITKSITPHLGTLRENVRNKWKKMLKKATSNPINTAPSSRPASPPPSSSPSTSSAAASASSAMMGLSHSNTASPIPSESGMMGHSSRSQSPINMNHNIIDHNMNMNMNMNMNNTNINVNSMMMPTSHSAAVGGMRRDSQPIRDELISPNDGYSHQMHAQGGGMMYANNSAASINNSMHSNLSHQFNQQQHQQVSMPLSSLMVLSSANQNNNIPVNMAVNLSHSHNGGAPNMNMNNMNMNMNMNVNMNQATSYHPNLSNIPMPAGNASHFATGYNNAGGVAGGMPIRDRNLSQTHMAGHYPNHTIHAQLPHHHSLNNGHPQQMSVYTMNADALRMQQHS